VYRILLRTGFHSEVEESQSGTKTSKITARTFTPSEGRRHLVPVEMSTYLVSNFVMEMSSLVK
jgi:hypothetical protein